MFAGVQIALTEPIRIGDVVIVQGEYGTIEEITLTYVVVRVWDERRLVVPIGWFLEQPFQNWTRKTTTLLGTVELPLDPTAPIAAIRERFEAVLDARPDLWDGRSRSVQVTDLRGGEMTVRLLVSAEGSSKLWDLRCLAREEVIAWLQAERPESLPRSRVAVDSPQTSPHRADAVDG